MPLIEAPDSQWRGIEIALDGKGRPADTPTRRGLTSFLCNLVSLLLLWL